MKHGSHAFLRMPRKCNFHKTFPEEKVMATHSSVLAWRIPGTGEPDGLPSLGSHRVGHDWSDLAAVAAEVVWKQGMSYKGVCSFSWSLSIGLDWDCNSRSLVESWNSWLRCCCSVMTSQTVARQASLSFILSWVCLNSCPLSWWCHPTISSSVAHHSCLQSFPASGSFPMSHLFTSGSQSTEASASAQILPMNIQDWFPLGLTGLISLGPRDSQSLLQHQFENINSSELSLLYGLALTFVNDYWKDHSFDYMDICRWSNVSAF